MKADETMRSWHGSVRFERTAARTMLRLTSGMERRPTVQLTKRLARLRLRLPDAVVRLPTDESVCLSSEVPANAFRKLRIAWSVEWGVAVPRGKLIELRQGRLDCCA